MGSVAPAMQVQPLTRYAWLHLHKSRSHSLWLLNPVTCGILYKGKENVRWPHFSSRCKLLVGTTLAYPSAQAHICTKYKIGATEHYKSNNQYNSVECHNVCFFTAFIMCNNFSVAFAPLGRVFTSFVTNLSTWADTVISSHVSWNWPISPPVMRKGNCYFSWPLPVLIFVSWSDISAARAPRALLIAITALFPFLDPWSKGAMFQSKIPMHQYHHSQLATFRLLSKYHYFN